MLNTLGYYGVFLGMRFKNDLAMKKVLDSGNYDSSQAITIKVAVSIPYMSDQSEFERVEGKFEHQGNLYRKVKQRYAKDTLTLICVKDAEHKHIDRIFSDYAKIFADAAPGNRTTSKITLNFLKDYLPVNFSIYSISAGWEKKVILNTRFNTLTPSFTASITHPPERG